jgi:hypothetical protein
MIHWRRRGGRRGRARAGPTAGPVALCSGPAPALAPFPVPGRSSLWTASCCWGGWLVLLLRGCDACRAVGGALQSGAALIGVRLDVGSLPPRSSSPTVTGGRLGGFPVGRDRWGGESVVGGVLPRISIGVGQGRLGPSHFFIPLVLGPLNSLVWYVPSLRYTRGLDWRMHCGAEVTESSTNKQHHLSLSCVCVIQFMIEKKKLTRTHQKF